MEIMRTDLFEHPAVKAWSELLPGRVEPESIEILKEHRKSAVYRLTGVGPGGSAVIAKRCRMATALIERTIYEEILPHLPITALHYYGFTQEDDEFCWLFLEDAGREQFSPLLEEHRTLAARWLARMHTSAAHVAAAARLPDRGPDHYLEHLRSGRHTILSNLTNSALTADDLAILETIISLCDTLELRWSRVEEECEGLPSTLVHGDFQPKNVHVRVSRAGTGLFPIDWETAGWGIAAADLAPAAGHVSTPQVDIALYGSMVRECWPGLDLQAIQRLVTVGGLFRRLAAVHWASRGLAYEYVEEPMACMRIYLAELSETNLAAKWTK